MHKPLQQESARSRLEALVRALKVPGIQYLILDGERILVEYSGGWADIAGRRPMTSSTTLMAYSMSKTITALAVLQLVESRKLRLDGTIDDFVPGQPYGAGITIRHLLTHTAGIPNPIPLSWVHSPSLHGQFDERHELESVLRKFPKPSRPPGLKFDYSNIGYWLLGPVVEQASGEKFTDYIRTHILTPLGIDSTEVDYRIAEPTAHAKGYLEKCSVMNLIKRFVVAPEWIGSYEDRWLHINDHYLNGPAFGGLVGTARGFGKFLQDQLGARSKILDGSTRELMYGSQRTDSGSPIPMSLGWHIASRSDRPFCYKEGGGGGFHCMMRVYRNSGLASVVMTNATRFDVRGLMDSIDREWLA